MKTILITAACLIAGVHHDAGEVVIVDESNGDSVISGNKGRQVPDGSKPEDFITNRDTPPETRDPVVAPPAAPPTGKGGKGGLKAQPDPVPPTDPAPAPEPAPEAPADPASDPAEAPVNDTPPTV